MDKDVYIVGAVAVAAVIAVVIYERSQDGGSDSPAPIDGGDYGGSPSAILSALASFENVASSHNNPGGICGGFDSNGNCTGPATYGSLADGIAAAESKISGWLAKNPLITVEQFVAKWSGATGDVLDNYVSHVSDSLGLDPSDPISDSTDDGVNF